MPGLTYLSKFATQSPTTASCSSRVSSDLRHQLERLARFSQRLLLELLLHSFPQSVRRVCRMNPADLQYSSYSRPNSGSHSTPSRATAQRRSAGSPTGRRSAVVGCAHEGDDGDADAGLTTIRPPSCRRRRGKLVAAARALLARGGFEALTVEARGRRGRAPTATRCATTSAARRPSSPPWSTRWRTTRASRAVAETRRLPAGRRARARARRRRPPARRRPRRLPRLLRASSRTWSSTTSCARGSRRCTTGTATCTSRASATPTAVERGSACARFASLMVAMTDGLAVQKLLDPDGVDLEPLFALWESMLASCSPATATPTRPR